jgi:Holliday junction resolvasome RuvABC endonuclease subunit
MDPSFRNWGLAYCEYDNGVITVLKTQLVQTVEPQGTKRSAGDIQSCATLFDALDEAMYQFSPDILVAEIPIGSRSSRAANGYGVCMALLGALSSYGVPMVHVTPNQVKGIVGSSTASKNDVIDWVLKKHPTVPFPRRGGAIVSSKSEHMADAIAALHAATKLQSFKDALNATINHA